MFRLAPLVSFAAAFSDETSLIQGLKPQVSPQKEVKSKAISNLLQSATQMLKNGVTTDVLNFTQETLTEITSMVLPAIRNATQTDQVLVDKTWAMFESEVLAPLRAGESAVATLRAELAVLSTAHKTCRAEEKEKCVTKRVCDYDLYYKWLEFVRDENLLRDASAEIETHFCAPDANGTTALFREYAFVRFDPWITMKQTVDTKELAYDGYVQTCEDDYKDLLDKTGDCREDQELLELKGCELSNKVNEVKNAFTESWAEITALYQRVVNEVHCLEIDRWKEWRTLTTIQCLLNRTAEMNGRPCDEDTNKVGDIVGACDGLQQNTSIEHIRIKYKDAPDYPTPLVDPSVPCTQAWHIQEEYSGPQRTGLTDWIPQPPFQATELLTDRGEAGTLSTVWNSHCFPFDACQIRADDCTDEDGYCDNACAGLVPLTPQCKSESAHPSYVTIPKEESECAQVTLDQLSEGEFDRDGDGHFTYNHTGVRSNDITNDINMTKGVDITEALTEARLKREEREREERERAASSAEAGTAGAATSAAAGSADA